MSFQRSYSKVWWGSDNQLSLMSSNVGSSLTSGGYYSCFSQQNRQQQQQRLQHQHQQQQPQQLHPSSQQNINGFSSSASGSNCGYHSLDYHNFRSYGGNLSRIQEVEDEQNISKLSWEKHDSPGSLRSQDSGFSDNEESHSTRSLGGRSSKTASPSSKSESGSNKGNNSDSSPVSPLSRSSSIATPPTVVRRVGKSEFYSPLVSISRRISFSGSPANESGSHNRSNNDTDINKGKEQKQEASVELKQSVENLELLQKEIKSSELTGIAPLKEEQSTTKQRRRRRVVRKGTKPLTPTRKRSMPTTNGDYDSEDSDVAKEECSAMPVYNNETVYLGASPPQAYNNETVILGSVSDDEVYGSHSRSKKNNSTFTISSDVLSPLCSHDRFTASTSTPRTSPKNLIQSPAQYDSIISAVLPTTEYENPLLNGHSTDIQSWFSQLRSSYEPEVMSTLQTKSITQEAFKNLAITTNTVAKLIRQLQQRAIYMQSDFETMERLLTRTPSASFAEALCSGTQLIANTEEFTKVLERRIVFFADSRPDRKRFEDNLEQIRIIMKDTRYSLEKHHYINLESLLDDVQVLKRYLVITIRLVFEKMVRIIVQSIEQTRCDLMLRANINMVATLMNIDYEGLAALSDAFVQNEVVRTLLIICLDHKLSSVRALALRALSTVCCSPAAIAQLNACDGIEILRDVLQVPNTQHGVGVKRSEVERREAVSLLTQITAAWHGAEHRVEGLKDCMETIVEGLTELSVRTQCEQTLLLCVAALNNLTRLEVTSHYSIMSNEALFKIIEVIERKAGTAAVFLYEQIVAMLHNMSLNKKCHSHLANGSIINFITSTYQTEFYKVYNSRAESDAQRRLVKTILHILTRLVHDSSLGAELLEQQRIPAFFKMAISDQIKPLDNSSRDISLLTHQLLQAQKEEKQRQAQFERGRNDYDREKSGELPHSGGTLTSALKLNLSRQESYV